MRPFLRPVLFAAIAYVTLLPSEKLLAQLAPYRSTVAMVSLNVTVLNAAHQHMGDLEPADFVVLENGVAQNVTFFAKANVPLAVALLVDSSASMAQAMTTAQDAAVGFTRSIGAADLVTVIDFDSNVETAQAFTNNRQHLEEGIRRLSAGGSTTLYNAVYIALNELKKVTVPIDEGAIRRRAIVVLSDGEDTSSLVTFEELLDAASRSDTMIYTIGLGGPEASSRPVGKAQEGAFVLRRLAEHTGGRAFFPEHPKDLAGVYAIIREDLGNQYSLAYESSNSQRDGAWRRIGVRVNRPNAVVRTRLGYFAAAK